MTPDLTATRDALFAAIRALDSSSLRRVVLDGQEALGTDVVVCDLLVPALREVGDLWEAGELSVLHEHHASQIIRAVLEEFRRQEVPDGAPRVVLACPPGELHELPLHLFGLLVAERGCDPFVLGASTPWQAIADARRILRSGVLVLAAARPAGFAQRTAPLRALARTGIVYVAGAAASGDLPAGPQRLPDDWRQAADLVAQAARRGGVTQDTMAS